MTEPRLIIIGASYAGQELAGAARSAGFLGAITVLGDEAEPPYQRPPLSKGFLLGTTTANRLPLVSPTYFTDRDINCRLNTAVSRINIAHNWVQTTSGERLSYDWLALCTGARASTLNVPGIAHPKVYSLRNLNDARQIKQLMACTQGPVGVIGGGFIGLEVTAALASAGLEVDLFESAHRLLARAVPEPISAAVQLRHQAAGVRVHLNSTIKSLTSQAGGGLNVHSSLGDFACAAVVVGIGATPNIELAQQAGIACGRGISIDTCGRTSVAQVLAAGDCAEFPVPFAPDSSLRILESIQATKDVARAAGSVIAGVLKPVTAVPWFWSDQYDLKLQMAGIMAATDTWVWRGDLAGYKGTLFGLRQNRLGCAFSLNNPAEHIMSRKLIASAVTLSEQPLSNPKVPLTDLFN